jgi:plasmid maintenance system antidote protein VapI
MKEQLQRIMDTYQLSAADFAKAVGINPSGLSHILSGNRNYLSTETVIKICKAFPDVRMEWLITGQGEMLAAKNRTSPSLTPSLFDVSGSKETEIDTRDNASKNVSPRIPLETTPLKTSQRKKRVDTIIFFFDDGSFSEYHPTQVNS